MQGIKKANLSDPAVRKRFVTYKEAAELYSMGLTKVQEHAKSAGATYNIGNKVLVMLIFLKLIWNNTEFRVSVKAWRESLSQIWRLCTDKKTRFLLHVNLM